MKTTLVSPRRQSAPAPAGPRGAGSGGAAGAPAGLPLFLLHAVTERGGDASSGAETSALEREADELSARVSLPSFAPPVSGAHLPLEARAPLESSLGYDLSGVRIHHDGHAAERARAEHANAFATGADIHFARGHFNPRTPRGGALLVHELAHVVQQGEAAPLSSSAGANGPSFGAAPSAPQRQEATPAVVPAAADPQRAPEAPRTPPVVWGLDTTTMRTYVSVRAPARQFGDLASYVYESAEARERLRTENGITEETLAPGRTLRLVEGTLTAGAHQALNAALEGGTVTRTQGIPSISAPESMLYRFSANGEQFELTQTQLRGMLNATRVALRRHAERLRSSAEGLLEVQSRHVENTNSVVRGISDWWGNAEMPSTLSYYLPMIRATATRDALDGFDPASGDVLEKSRWIAAVAPVIRGIAEDVDTAERRWRRYIRATIEGAEGMTRGLEIVRDVSFGVAIGIGAVVAFPVVAGSAAIAGTLGTGTAATLAAGGVVVVGGGAAGATLRGGSSLLGQGLTGSVDWGQVGSDAWQGARRGAVDAFFGLVAPGISSGVSRVGTAGLTRVLGAETLGAATRSMGTNTLGRFALRAASTVPGAAAVGSLHAGTTTALTGNLADVPAAMRGGLLFGGGMGLAGTALAPLLSRLFSILPNSFSFRPRTTAYHGTDPQGAAAIRQNGPQIRGGANDDFGPGFYASESAETASQVGSRFGRPPAEVLAVPIPLRQPYLDITRGRWARLWEQFLDEPFFPGGLPRRTAFFDLRTGNAGGPATMGVPSDVRNQLLRQFMRQNNIPEPTVVRGPLPQYGPGATQIAVLDAQTLAMIREALQYQPPAVAAFIEGLLGSVLGRPQAEVTPRR